MIPLIFKTIKIAVTGTMTVTNSSLGSPSYGISPIITLNLH